MMRIPAAYLLVLKLRFHYIYRAIQMTSTLTLAA